MSAKCFEQRMTWCYPLEVVVLGCFSIGRDPWILRRNRRQFPIGRRLIALQHWRRFSWIEGMLQRSDWFDIKRCLFRRFLEKASNGFGDNATFLRPCTPFD